MFPILELILFIGLKCSNDNDNSIGLQKLKQLNNNEQQLLLSIVNDATQKYDFEDINIYQNNNNNNSISNNDDSNILDSLFYTKTPSNKIQSKINFTDYVIYIYMYIYIDIFLNIFIKKKKTQ